MAILGAAASVSVTTTASAELREDEMEPFTPPPPPDEFASTADGETQSDTCEIAPPSEFRESGDEVVHSNGDEDTPSSSPCGDPDELKQQLIDELKQGRVTLKHNPACPGPTSTRFHAVEMIY